MQPDEDCSFAEARRRDLASRLLAHARLAARNGVVLDTVLRSQAAIFDRLIATIGEEYTRELEGRADASQEQQALSVKRLLAGERIDTVELDYDLKGHHLGVVAADAAAQDLLPELAGQLECSLSIVFPDEATVWAWLGSGTPIDPARVQKSVADGRLGQVPLAVGEPASGLAGWRFTHRQAQAAFAIALRNPDGFARYSEVALLAAVLRDELLTLSLFERYLGPLAQERDGGSALCETLRAYFSAEHNVSSAAAALGVNRHTVTGRLRTVEERIGCPLSRCTAEMEVALGLLALDYRPTVRGAAMNT